LKNLVVIASLLSIVSCGLNDKNITKIGNYDNPQKALLVMDMQIDFIDENGKFPIEKNQINDLIAIINHTIDDFHKNDYEIIYIRNIFNKNDKNNKYRNYSGIEGTSGIEIDPRINIVSENIFTKNSSNAFTNKDFENYLIQRKINELYLCGVMADVCVYETSLGAFNRNYKVNYISNAVGAISAKDIEKTIQKLKKKGINIIEY